MELYKILFIIGAVLVIIGLVPAVVDSIKKIFYMILKMTNRLYLKS